MLDADTAPDVAGLGGALLAPVTNRRKNYASSLLASPPRDSPRQHSPPSYWLAYVMLCLKMATRRDGVSFPCGQCTNCKINKRRDWNARLLLEAASHAYSVFVTLTFADHGTQTILRRSDVHCFTKTLNSFVPHRFFCAAEYGSKTGRAHYHIHLFSDSPIQLHHLHESWPFGAIDVGNTEPASLDYTLGYLLKDKKKIWPVEHVYPEFRVFSQGLGKFALPHLLIDGTELPREFTVFGRTWPIGRYLRDRAKKMGFTVSERKSKRLEAFEAQQMRFMLANPSLTDEEVNNLYSRFVDARNQRAKLLQQKAIRDAYRTNHGHTRSNRNETF